MILLRAIGARALRGHQHHRLVKCTTSRSTISNDIIMHEYCSLRHSMICNRLSDGFVNGTIVPQVVTSQVSQLYHQ